MSEENAIVEVSGMRVALTTPATIFYAFEFWVRHVEASEFSPMGRFSGNFSEGNRHRYKELEIITKEWLLHCKKMGVDVYSALMCLVANYSWNPTAAAVALQLAADCVKPTAPQEIRITKEEHIAIADEIFGGGYCRIWEYATHWLLRIKNPQAAPSQKVPTKNSFYSMHGYYPIIHPVTLQPWKDGDHPMRYFGFDEVDGKYQFYMAGKKSEIRRETFW